MAVATWKDLCLDALDRRLMADFWGPVIGAEVVVSTRNVWLDGPTAGHRIRVNQVDRPHRVKNRVHLDVYVASVAALVDRGARVLAPAEETGLGWTLMADPEDNEFCAFVREPAAMPAYRLHGIGIDCRDAAAQAAWWGEVFGRPPVHTDGDDFWSLEGATPIEGLTLDFALVPEPRSAPNRVHWDVVADADALIALGATALWATADWRVLADPEGNEFCVVAPA